MNFYQANSEADKAMEKMKAVEGVQNVRMCVVEEIVVVQDWLRNQSAKRLWRFFLKESRHRINSYTSTIVLPM